MAQSDIAHPEIAVEVGFAPYRISNNTMLTVLDLNKKIELKFSDVFLDQDSLPAEELPMNDQNIGKIDWRSSQYNQFVSASDKYLVLSRTINQRKITGIVNSTKTYWKCTNYKAQWQKYTYNHCRSVWEEIPNPEYDSEFSCADVENFYSCLLDNENKFIKSTSVYKGKECKEHEYWRGKCLTRENIISHDQRFSYKWETHSEMIIYRFTPNGFTRIGDPNSEDVLRVDGFAKEHKSFYFKNEHFYVVTTSNQDDGFWQNQKSETALHTFAVGENSLLKTHRLGGLGLGEQLRAVLFADKVLYLVTYRAVDPLYGIDLSIPHTPRLASELKIPGFSSQLILHENKLIGIGRGDKNNTEGRTSHVKLSLFATDKLDEIYELDNALIGEKSERSNNNVEHDDQLFHFQKSESRLFLPYSTHDYISEQKNYADAYICRKQYSEQRHWINISNFANDDINPEANFEIPVNITRQIAIDPKAALAFGETAVYSMKKEENSWSLEKIKEEYSLESIYRDPALPENMLVGKMVKRKGWQLSHLKFIMGTYEQFRTNTPAFTIELPEEMLKCLGSPNVRFLDHNVLLTFRSHTQSKQNPIDHNLAWAFTASGIKELSQGEVSQLAEEKRKYCKLNKEISETISKEDFKVLLQSLSAQDLECRDDKKYSSRSLFCQHSGLQEFCLYN